MSFFENLAHDKASSDEAFRVASKQAYEEVTERFSSFVETYGEDSVKVIASEIEDMISGIAEAHNVEDRIAAITKSALFGLGNPLMKDRKNWSQDQWDDHYQGQHPDALVKHPELDGVSTKAEAIYRMQQAQQGAERAKDYPAPHPTQAFPLTPYQPHNQHPDALVKRPELDGISDKEEAIRRTQQAYAAKDESGTPSPKMDKRLWTPKTVGPLKGVDDPKGKNPTKRVDVATPVIKKDFTELKDIGEATTEKYDLNKDKQSSSDSSAD